MTDKKKYLGDGVYAEFDGDLIVLTVEDGVTVSDPICLDRDTYENLVLVAEQLKRNGEF